MIYNRLVNEQNKAHLLTFMRSLDLWIQFIHAWLHIQNPKDLRWAITEKRKNIR